jgi:ribosome-binding factor A
VGYPRTARVNAVLLQVLGDALERQRDDDERLALLTVTAVSVDADLRHATVFMASLPEGALPALEAQRPELQAVIAREVRLKRTPTLRFVADPAIAAGERVEEALRRVRHDDA